MFYYYINPRTNKSVICKDFDHSVEEQLLEDKENDYLIAISTYSNAIKIIKWHFCRYGGDYEDSPETLAEIKLSSDLAKHIVAKSLGTIAMVHDDREIKHLIRMFKL